MLSVNEFCRQAQMNVTADHSEIVNVKHFWAMTKGRALALKAAMIEI